MILLVAALLAATAPAPSVVVGAAGGPVTIAVGNVRSATGRVRVALCAASTFMKHDCAYHEDAPAVAGVTQVTVPNVAPGIYAAQVFHDSNANGEVDRGAFGVPLEGVGFSNDARIGLTGPRFAKAAFSHGGESQTLRVTLKHYTPNGRQVAR